MSMPRKISLICHLRECLSRQRVRPGTNVVTLPPTWRSLLRATSACHMPSRHASYSSSFENAAASRAFSSPSLSAELAHTSLCLDAFNHDAPLTASWNDYTPIEWASTSEDGQMVSVRWVDGEVQDYPAVWLRDNCHCERCCHHLTHTRSTYVTDLNLETEVKSASVMEGGQVLSVIWSDTHLGDFPANWLRGHRFDASSPDPIEGAQRVLWGSDVMDVSDFRTFDFQEVMESDDALYQWLRLLHDFGIGILKNAPKKQGQQVVLQNRLGYESPAPSSSGILNQAKLHLKKNHPLYTEKGLQLHTDLAYYTQPRGFQLFHCIQQVSGSGGDSLLVDGFKAAEDLRSTSPEAFKILTSVPWEYKLAFENNYHVARHNSISIDESGSVYKIVVNDICRTSMLRMAASDVHKAYSALKEFNTALYDPANLFRYKLEAGDILAFHNHRVLHGRLGFSLQAETQRHLETCYSDWEVVSARMRQLAKRKLLNP
ncbi:gamma-butyrobetaine dioxygenase-like [Diadema antillarum]|uniref:gamma-butyrobetaine dioxygenase-like n=1 Tax=Diadema antillarum TaxID=105358 RepID=UPI003A885679